MITLENKIRSIFNDGPKFEVGYKFGVDGWHVGLNGYAEYEVMTINHKNGTAMCRYLGKEKVKSFRKIFGWSTIENN
jgi:hypothetical protein